VTTPTKSEIINKATEMWKLDRMRAHDPSYALNPQVEELKESGFLSAATSELMRDEYKQIEANKDYFETEDLKERETLTKNGFEVNVQEAFKNGLFIAGSTGSGKSDVAMEAVTQLPKSTVIVVFDPSQDWQNRSSIGRYMTLETSFIEKLPQDSIIYDISLLSTQQTQRLVENFSERLMRQQAETPKSQRKQYFIVFEEGHEYFSEGVLRAKRLESTVKIMTRGRNFRIRFACITPFSSLIDKKAMKYMAQRYFGYTSEPNDIRYLREFLKEDVEKLKTLKAGEFMYYSRGKVELTTIRPFKTKTTPKKVNIFRNFPEPTQLSKQHDGISFTKLCIAILWFIAILAAAVIKP
jgi:hypothetical protein